MLMCISRSRAKYQHPVGSHSVGFNNAGILEAQNAIDNRNAFDDFSKSTSPLAQQLKYAPTRKKKANGKFSLYIYM